MACKCSDYSAGQLREIVAFRREVRVPDGAGGRASAWVAVLGAPTRAYVKALSGSERLASDRIDASVRLRVVVRYKPGIEPGQAVVIRGRSHNIRFVNNVELRDKWLEIDVDGGVAV